MKYPKLLQKGDTIGICAPSDGYVVELEARFDKARSNVEALGYKTLATASVKAGGKCVSAPADVRAEEFMSLYENPSVAAIIPPWGGEFLVDILPLLDFERISALPPTWVCGYSDISTLTVPLTLLCDVATVHGSNLMNMGHANIHESDLRAFEAMSNAAFFQHSAPFWGDFSGAGIEDEIYALTKESKWKSIDNKSHVFTGRMIGGCMDVLCKLLGTRFAPVCEFIEKYKKDGFIWTLESCEMNAADIYRALWQMRECSWFEHCRGVIYGRVCGYEERGGFTLEDALSNVFAPLGIPVVYDADIGHTPPQMQVVNGALGKASYSDGKATVWQELA
ncbi:MAG: LD-carboxypeptidase [Clostridiales bacterium]|nr:LD-carboxypeptidase [Clostridiales bacterium]